MQRFNIETSDSSESNVERLYGKFLKCIKDIENEIAVEIHGFGIGRANEHLVTDEQQQNETAECYAHGKETLIDLFDGSSVQTEIIALYEAYVAGESDIDTFTESVKQLLFTSDEYKVEVTQHEKMSDELRAEFAVFLDEIILRNQNDRALMSKWGIAKLAYEKGESEALRKLLVERAASIKDTEEEIKIKLFLKSLF